MAKIDAPALKDVQAAVSPDGETVLLGLKAADDRELAVRLSGQQLSTLVTLLLAMTREAAARQSNGEGLQKGLPAKPLPVQSIGVGLGQHDGEAVLALRLGLLTLGFSVKMESLLHTCRSLQMLSHKKISPAEH